MTTDNSIDYIELMGHFGAVDALLQCLFRIAPLSDSKSTVTAGTSLFGKARPSSASRVETIGRWD
jgi:hypothetical protein